MTACDFIFMLTRADRTVPQAAELVAVALKTGVKHIGFKDVGLPPVELMTLTEAIRAGGATVYLEVVSLDAQSERRSAEMGVRLGVDVLMGGTRPEVVAPVIAGTAIRYLPFAGDISGHPSILGGTIETIAARAAALVSRPEVDGIDLLAFRFAGDVPALITAVRGHRDETAGRRGVDRRSRAPCGGDRTWRRRLYDWDRGDRWRVARAADSGRTASLGHGLDWEEGLPNGQG